MVAQEGLKPPTRGQCLQGLDENYNPRYRELNYVMKGKMVAREGLEPPTRGL